MTFDELLHRQREPQGELREVQGRMASYVMNYKGTVQEALKEGLVRLNFQAPPGFSRHLRNQ